MSIYGPEEAQGGDIEKHCPNPDCPWPGGSFWTNEPRQVYCSNKYQQRQHNQRYYEAHREEMIQRAPEYQQRQRSEQFRATFEKLPSRS